VLQPGTARCPAQLGGRGHHTRHRSDAEAASRPQRRRSPPARDSHRHDAAANQDAARRFLVGTMNVAKEVKP
jgi:hypothetical protein